MKIQNTPLLLVALAHLAVSSVQAQTVTGIFLGKSAEFVQTDATTTTPNPAATGPTYGGPYSFTASVAGTGLSAPTVTLATGSGMPTTYPDSHNGGVLGYNADEGEWQYGSPNFNNWATPTAAQRNSLFANGDYTFSIPGFDPVTLNLMPATHAPGIPLLTLTGGTWADGRYQINTGQTLTITSNAASSFHLNVNGHIYFEIFSNSGGADLVSIERLYSDNTSADNFFSYTVDPGTLIAGHEYSVEVGYAAIVDADETIPDSLSVAFFGTSTTVTLSAIPEPSTYAAMAGVLALGLAVWRRRGRQAIT